MEQKTKKKPWLKLKNLSEYKDFLRKDTFSFEPIYMKNILKNLSEEDQDLFLDDFFDLIQKSYEYKIEKKDQEVFFRSIIAYVKFHPDKNKSISLIKDRVFKWDAHLTKSFIQAVLEKNSSDLDEDSQEFIFALAVVYQVGILYAEKNPHSHLLDYLKSYLISLANYSDIKVRLYLFYFFGKIAFELGDKEQFNKIIGRFGHSVIEHLFELLFHKKSEMISLEFMIQIMPFILQADAASQKILHQSFRHYMMKFPEKFFIFFKLLKSEIDNKISQFEFIEENIIHHLTALYAVACELEHIHLAREIFSFIIDYESSKFYKQSLKTILDDQNIKAIFKEPFVAKDHHSISFSLRNDLTKHKKRGRKPVFKRSKTMDIYHTINYLGKVVTDR